MSRTRPERGARRRRGRVTTQQAVLRRRPVVAWALYDWANSAFACTVMAGFFPVFFKQYWNAGVVATESTFRLGLTSGIASLLVAVLAPVLGAIADRSSSRLRLLFAFTLLGSVATLALAFVPQGQWAVAAGLFLLASLGFWGGIVFSDSLLLHVAEPEEYDLVSGFGYALGYLGGGLLFAGNVLMTQRPEWFGLANAAEAVRWSFVTVGIWWLLFALPCVLWVKERPFGTAAQGRRVSWRQATREGFVELAHTVGEIRKYRPLVWFLAAYILYIDGVNTVIKMAVDYGLSLGFDQSHLVKALLLTQFVAFPAALAFGWLGARIGARNGIFLALAVYLGATGYAYFLDDAGDFYLLAFVVGLVQGGIQSLSRSYYGRLVPRDKSSEFFGFYNMMGKASAIIGPTLVGITAAVTGDSRLSILSIIVLFVAGAALLVVARRAEQGARAATYPDR
ncbi:MAG TPA: MFS transporter [Steroidobacteraceae bacterium]|nr:MFS transporter [Steroidobacteraceae bacterium]